MATTKLQQALQPALNQFSESVDYRIAALPLDSMQPAPRENQRSINN